MTLLAVLKVIFVTMLPEILYTSFFVIIGAVVTIAFILIRRAVVRFIRNLFK